MAVRETMAELIGRLRTLIGDPAGDDAMFGDEELQAFLDARSTEYRYLELTPVATIAPGGSVVHLEYVAALRREWRDGVGLCHTLGDWEDGVKLYGPDYAEIEPATADLARGRWTFEAHQPAQVRLVGRTYDLNAAGADALEAWATRVKAAYDIRSGDQSLARGMQFAQIMAAAMTLRRRARVGAGRIGRSDLC